MKWLRYIFLTCVSVYPLSAQQVIDPATLQVTPASQNAKQASATPQNGTDTSVSSSTTTNVLLPGWQQDQKPGNYQKKALAFKKAGELYDQIRQIEPVLQKLRESFFSKKSKINKKMDTFFFEIGSNQSELQDEIDDLIAQLSQDAVDDGQLSEEEREILQQTDQNKVDLKQLKQNITVLGEFSNSLDNALAQFDNQVGLLQKFEDQAWTSYQKIDEIFDDKQAAQLVDQINLLLANAQAIKSYIQGSFTQFFSSTSDTLDNQMENITSTIKKLDDRGVALSKIAKQLDEEEDAARQAEKQAAKDAKEAKEQARQAQTFTGRIKKLITDAWSWIRGATSNVYQMIVSTPQPAKQQSASSHATSAQYEEVQKQQQDQPENQQISPTLPLLPIKISTPIQPQPLPQDLDENAA